MRRIVDNMRRLAMAALLLAAGAVGAHETLTVVTWGGAYTKSQMLGYIRDFQRDSGVDVEVLEYGGGLESIRQQTREWNVRWDVVDLELHDAIRACDEGLIEPVDPEELAPAPDGTAATDDFLPGTLRKCAVGTVIWATAIAYDTQRVRRAPQQLADFFDARDFPGQRGLRRTPKGNLELALMADGVPPSQVYETLATDAGVNRAFAMLDRIKPWVKWWDSGAEAVQLLESGQVTMTTAYHGRVHNAREERGAELAVVWDGHLRNLDLWAVPVHGEKTERAMDFLRFATRPSSLAAQTRYIPYAPVRRSALTMVDPAVRQSLPPGRGVRHLQTDAAWWAEHINTLQPRFERWLDKTVRVPERLPR